MEFSHSEYAIQTREPVLQNLFRGVRRVLVADPGLTAQILLTAPIIAGGIILNLSALQWVLTVVVTLLYLMTVLFRGASLLQLKSDPSMNAFHAKRIRCMGNALVTITAGLSLLTYLLIFVPRIIQLI